MFLVEVEHSKKKKRKKWCQEDKGDRNQTKSDKCVKERLEKSLGEEMAEVEKSEDNERLKVVRDKDAGCDNERKATIAKVRS